jgi:hypothetical protein
MKRPRRLLKNFAPLVKQALLGGTVLAGQPVEIWFQML